MKNHQLYVCWETLVVVNSVT